MSKFEFHANALAVGGRYKTPSGDVGIIPSLASVVLAPNGGEGRACVENYHSEAVSFTRAESRVVGAPQSGNVFSTYADIFITNLTLFQKFRVALLQATITSTRDITDGDARFQIHAIYRGVTIDGVEVLPELDYDICGPTMYDQFANMLCQKHATRPAYKELYGQDATKLRQALDNHAKPFRGTLAPELELRPKGNPPSKRPNKTVAIPGVGRVRFGDFAFTPGKRRVSLLRLELGRFDEFVPMRPAIDGEIAAASSESGGTEHDSDNQNQTLEGDVTIASVEGNGAPIDENH
jgi:hypothetical protein